MQSLRTRLPPVNSLVAFEASARHLSFTRAADELTISREAVSRHIRILEGHLGVKLFNRMHRAIELTKEGEAFRSAVQRSLEDIAGAADGLRGGSGRPKLIVSATIAISSFWLTPRLPRFRADHPDAEIRVVVSDAPVRSITERFDFAVRYGDGAWPGYTATHLFDVTSTPVCSPGYAQASGAIETPGDLVGHTLLNLDGTVHATEDWTWWLSGQGVPAGAELTLLGFDNYANVIQAALEGQGIALGFSGIVDQLLERGALVRPVDASLSRGQGVFALTPAGSTLKPPARTFFDWILAEAGVH
jgi:LysR family glycine cleavage system transcriptional activator